MNMGDVEILGNSSPSLPCLFLNPNVSDPLLRILQGSDHLSVRVSTDANGNKVGEQGHYPYWEVWYSANTTTKSIFTGYERDSESGTQNGNEYALARYYRVAFGRFCSADPVFGSPGDPQSWNRYAYVRDRFRPHEGVTISHDTYKGLPEWKGALPAPSRNR
jgi:RHS repeat-associated protein